VRLLFGPHKNLSLLSIGRIDRSLPLKKIWIFQKVASRLQVSDGLTTRIHSIRSDRADHEPNENSKSAAAFPATVYNLREIDGDRAQKILSISHRN
jgi:hypothetical protein